MRDIWGLMTAAVAAGLLLIAAGGNAHAAAPEPKKSFSAAELGPLDKDPSMGKADAPVTMVEYASLTCPHCANFNNTVLPLIKKNYIDTGKVRYIYRDFPLDRYALQASMLARCAGPDRYFGFIETLFRGQAEWVRSPKGPLEGLKALVRRIVLLGQIPNYNIDKCLADKTIEKAVLQQRLHASQVLKVDSTPTLIINRKMYSYLSYNEFKAVVDPLLPKK